MAPPGNQAANRENKHYPKAWGVPSLLKNAFLKRPWEKVREAVEVKLLDKDGEIYVLAKSAGRVDKERAMRRRRLKKLWKLFNNKNSPETNC